MADADRVPLRAGHEDPGVGQRQFPGEARDCLEAARETCNRQQILILEKETTLDIELGLRKQIGLLLETIYVGSSRGRSSVLVTAHCWPGVRTGGEKISSRPM